MGHSGNVIEYLLRCFGIKGLIIFSRPQAALKHAAINLVTILIFLFVLYKRGSPVAFAISDQFSKLWRNLKHRMFFHAIT